MERRTTDFRTKFTVAGDVIRDALANAYEMGEAKDRSFRRINEVTCLVQALANVGYEIVPKAKAGRPHIEERTTIDGVTTTRTVELVPGGQETETEKAAREASVLIAQILEDGGLRQAAAGVEVAAKEAGARLKRDRARLSFEDIDRNPPAGACLGSDLVATWVRNFGDAVVFCEGQLGLRKLGLIACLRCWPTREQQVDLQRRVELIRGMGGVVGANYRISGSTEATVNVDIRFDHYITTVGVEYTPLDLPPRPALRAA